MGRPLPPLRRVVGGRVTAEEYFDWVRSAALEAGRLATPVVDGGSRSSGTAAPRAAKADPIGAMVAAKVDAEERRLRERSHCERVVEHGRLTIHRVGMALGPDVALSLRLHYVDLIGWEDISFELHLSLSSLYRMRRRAFEWVDCAGIVKDDQNFGL